MLRNLIAFSLMCLPLTSVCQQRYYVSEEGGGSHCGTSWADASSDLFATVEMAQIGDTVWVAAGRYIGGFYFKDGVAVLGGFRVGAQSLYDRLLPYTGENLTILDGDGRFRVLSQSSTAVNPSYYDGFVITGGSALNGAGAQIGNNNVLRNCYIQYCKGGRPSIGEREPDMGGIIFDVDTTANIIHIISEINRGRHYQLMRAKEVESGDATQNHNDWRIPLSSEWQQIMSAPTYNVVEHELKKFGSALLSGEIFWSQTAALSADMDGAMIADFRCHEIRPANQWQYCRLRPSRSYVITFSNSYGGGVYATGGIIDGCFLQYNKATNGCGIYARGSVIIKNTLLTKNDGTTTLDADGNVTIIDTTDGINGTVTKKNILTILSNPIHADGKIVIGNFSPGSMIATYTMSGLLYGSQYLSNESTIKAPSTPGVYFINIVGQTLMSAVKIIVIP